MKDKTKTFKVNITCPITGKGLVGFAQKYSDITFLVKTIKGIFEVLTEEITFRFGKGNKTEIFLLTQKLKLS